MKTQNNQANTHQRENDSNNEQMNGANLGFVPDRSSIQRMKDSSREKPLQMQEDPQATERANVASSAAESPADTPSTPVANPNSPAESTNR